MLVSGELGHVLAGAQDYMKQGRLVLDSGSVAEGDLWHMKCPVSSSNTMVPEVQGHY